MLEFYEPEAAIIEDSIAKAVERVYKTNKRILDFSFGVQRAMLEEVIFIGNEFLDRVMAETPLFGEIASKAAGSHSVKGLRTMCEECGQHQIDYVRRDSEQVFKHGERMIEAVHEPDQRGGAGMNSVKPISTARGADGARSRSTVGRGLTGTRRHVGAASHSRVLQIRQQVVDLVRVELKLRHGWMAGYDAFGQGLAERFDGDSADAGSGTAARS